MSKINESLEKSGWQRSSSAPLVLNASLTHHIKTTARCADGTEGRYKALSLRRAGSRYVAVWSYWQQSAVGEDKGYHGEGSAEFDPTVDAVMVGYAHAMTIDIETCNIIFWTKPSRE